MGQYHLTVNLDRSEFLDPHTLGDGLKLLEQGSNPNPGITTALLALLACSNDRGGGDFSDHPLVGRWTGDRIAVVGDYAESDDIRGCDASVIYAACRRSYRYADPIPTRLDTACEGEVFYLQDHWSYGLWRCQGPVMAPTDDVSWVAAKHEQTAETQRFSPGAGVVVIGMPYAKWTDLSWTIARFLEAEFGGAFQGAGWRHWHDNAAA